MKPTKHATTNYRRIKPFLDAVKATENGAAKFTSAEYMPLHIECIDYGRTRGTRIYSIAHYDRMNGDAMRDPEMTVEVNPATGTVEPLTFQNDYMGMYREVYCNDGWHYRPELRTSLDDFLWHWLQNIIDQGFTPDKQ